MGDSGRVPDGAARTPPPSIPHRRPLARLVLRELSCFLEHAHLRAQWEHLPRPQVGNGRRVVLFPGWASGGRSMRFVRSYLDSLGFEVRSWGQGRNVGDFRRYVPRATARVGELADEIGAPVALVGHSLGGWVAREVARERPDLVSRVVTLGTPTFGGPKHTLFGTLAHRYADPDDLEAELSRRFERPLVVPVTAIRSDLDGLVPPPMSRDDWSPAVHHVDVEATHIGMVGHPEVLCHIGSALASDR